jgi:hypothetical protein
MVVLLTPEETPRADPHAGCCGGRGRETPGYSIGRFFIFVFGILTRGQLFVAPVLTDLFGCPSYFVHQGLNWVGLAHFVVSKRLDAKLIQSGKYWCHGSVGGAEKDAATDADKHPVKPLKYRLFFDVAVKLLGRVPALSVTFNRQLSGLPFNHEVDAVGPNVPLRFDAISGCQEAVEHEPLKYGIGSFALFLHRAKQRLRVSSVLNQPTT